MSKEPATVNKVKEFILRANGGTTGITDWNVVLLDPTNTTSSITPTITEVGNGSYKVSFTPDVVGTWEMTASSASNGDVHRLAFDVRSKDESDISSEVGGVQTTVNDIEGKVDNIQNNLGDGGFI